MKNFPVIHDGKEYWISRAITMVIKFIGQDNSGKQYVLAVQRGEGTPDPEFIGSWCMPCGYLDFDETILEGAARELKEETGIEIDPLDLVFVNINDVPELDKRQNVTFRFKGYLPYDIEDSILSNKDSEENEVSNIKWIPLDEVDNYKWAFNHDKLIKEL